MDIIESITITAPTKIYRKENDSCSLLPNANVFYKTPEGKKVFYAHLIDGLLLENGEYILEGSTNSCCLTKPQLTDIIELVNDQHTQTVNISNGSNCEDPMYINLCNEDYAQTTHREEYTNEQKIENKKNIIVTVKNGAVDITTNDGDPIRYGDTNEKFLINRTEPAIGTVNIRPVALTSAKYIVEYRDA